MSNSTPLEQRDRQLWDSERDAENEHGLTPHQNSRRGFTLIELILVLVIVGFLISLVAPAITSTTGLSLKTGAKRIAAGLRYARSQAVTTGSVYQIRFDMEQGEMTIERVVEEDPYGLQTGGKRWWEAEEGEEKGEEEGPPGELYEKKIYRLPKGITIARVIADDEEINEGEALIDFYPNGSCSGGDVFLMDSKERVYRIALEFITGFVKIEEEET
jgi:general secretion pathway protein H